MQRPPARARVLESPHIKASVALLQKASAFCTPQQRVVHPFEEKWGEMGGKKVVSGMEKRQKTSFGDEISYSMPKK